VRSALIIHERRTAAAVMMKRNTEAELIKLKAK